MVEKKKNEKEKIEKKRKKAKTIPAADIEHPEEKIEDLNKKLLEGEDKLLRLAAEYDNYRKRSAREFGNLITNANEEMILRLIPVIDNFERALEAASTSKSFDSLHAGVEMIYQQMECILEKEGVEVINALNERFDPNLHEAVAVIEDAEAEPETVVEEVEKGYTLNDKVIRASKVVVSK